MSKNQTSLLKAFGNLWDLGKMMSKALAAQNDDQRHPCRADVLFQNIYGIRNTDTEYAIRNTQYTIDIDRPLHLEVLSEALFEAYRAL